MEEIRKKLVGESWYLKLRPILESVKFQQLGEFLAAERLVNTVYPAKENVFKAFHETPFESIKVVILGQDPYHDGKATGLAFANPADAKVIAPSLRYIIQEVEQDIYHTEDIPYGVPYDLVSWARQGVLLLNTALTVRKGQPASHTGHWAFFTTGVMEAINKYTTGTIFLLWGKHAQSYKKYINPVVHHILECGHPVTPAYGKNSWSGNKHFSQTNELLIQMNGPESIIKW